MAAARSASSPDCAATVNASRAVVAPANTSLAGSDNACPPSTIEARIWPLISSMPIRLAKLIAV